MNTVYPYNLLSTFLIGYAVSIHQVSTRNSKPDVFTQLAISCHHIRKTTNDQSTILTHRLMVGFIAG
jgi:hypothetical protein